jgi:hypothetical protein
MFVDSCTASGGRRMLRSIARLAEHRTTVDWLEWDGRFIAAHCAICRCNLTLDRWTFVSFRPALFAALRYVPEILRVVEELLICRKDKFSAAVDTLQVLVNKLHRAIPVHSVC